jgi:predicted metal-dependent HD superfamily phosphohydrolase
MMATHTNDGHPGVDWQAAWHAAWHDLGLPPPPDEQRLALLSAYAEPHRRYHSQQHLGECLKAFDKVRHLAQHPGEVALALWCHDAVYNPRAKDNEARSVEWAARLLAGAGAKAEVGQRVQGLIMATCHTALPETADAQLLVDIDLGILGAPPTRFDEYEQQVRAEYSFVPGWLFKRTRRGILKEFLARPALYSTPHFQALLETRARANLQRSLQA